MEEKRILDATCGGRMMWFDKRHPLVLYMDNECRSKGCIDQQPEFCVEPDIIADFRDMPFDDETFDLVIFDPPHANISPESIIGLKYGSLTTIEDISDGIDECMRVLKMYGILIFKWGEVKYTVRDVLDAINHTPLFGHTTGKSGKTKWMCFMKMPSEEDSK